MANNCSLHIFLRSRQRGETRMKDKLNWSWLRTERASGTGLFESKMSWVWRTSLAISAEEKTMVVTWPSFKVIIGP